MEPLVQVHRVKMHQSDSRAECGQQSRITPISLGIKPSEHHIDYTFSHCDLTMKQKAFNNEILKERTRITNIIVFLCLIQYENSKLVLKKVTFII